MIMTRNSFADLNVFFHRSDYLNIYRPNISHLKVDNASSVQPAYHIGFKENMGYLSSNTVTAGTMVFEVFEGFPLYGLLMLENASTGGVKYNIEDLRPMDFYCMNKREEDPYGDFVLKDVKFVSSRMSQGVGSPGRTVIAEFVCKSMKPFRLPHFFNKFISDNYDNHIIRSKKEIEAIAVDIETAENNDFLKQETVARLKKILGGNQKPALTEVLFSTFNTFQKTVQNRTPNYSYLKQIREFIKEFYYIKNRKELQVVNVASKNDFLSFLKNGGGV